MVVEAMKDPARHAGKTYRPTGPKLLGAEDIAQIIARVVGRKIRLLPTPTWMFMKTARLAGLPLDLISNLRYYIDDHKSGVFELGAPTSDVLDVTGQAPEDFETIARRYAMLPQNRRTLGNWVRQVGEFMITPLSPAYNLDRYDRELRRPSPSPSQLSIQSKVWRTEHGIAELSNSPSSRRDQGRSGLAGAAAQFAITSPSNNLRKGNTMLTIPALLSTAFLAYIVFIAGLMAAVMIRSLPARAAGVGVAALVGWVAYNGILGYSGVVAGSLFGIPGIAALVAPVLTLLTVVLVISPVGRFMALNISLPLLIGLQAFRVGVEWTLHQLWVAGAVPHLLTLSGGNIEILIGLSAPLMAWISLRGIRGRRIAAGWAVLGLLSLVNVSVRAVLSGPLHVLHTEVPNVALGMFPFSFIPGFMAPLAVVLHILALKAASLPIYEKSTAVTA